MLKIYSKPSCSSSRKIRAWFKGHHLAFEEINLGDHKISQKEIKEMLALTQLGTGELVSFRSKTYKTLSKRIDFEELTFNDLVRIVQAYPTLLKTPIIFDGKTLLVGYDLEEMRIFLPKIYRRMKNEQYRALSN